MSEIDDASLQQELAEDFGVEEKRVGRSPLEQRILAGFEEIERFVEQHRRLPQHGEDRDIFERLYAVRLDRLRRSPQCRAVLKDHDPRGILGTALDASNASADELDDAQLRAELGDLVAENDVSRLVHVRSHEDRKAAVEVAQRTPCADFDTFRPIFEQVQRELDAKVRRTVPFEHQGWFDVGDLFILDGQMVYVASVGEVIEKDFGREDSRLRIIFDNGTESNMLLRSLQRALYKSESGRRILLPDGNAVTLFTGVQEEGDLKSGTIYVLRSRSDHPFVKEHRAVLHKIGVTGGNVKARIGNAKKDPTYLLADVEVVAEYKLANVSRKALEALLHKVFAAARLDMQLKDRFGSRVEPREWFLLPLTVIDEAIERIKDGSIDRCRYDLKSSRLVSN
ncbi:MAG: GIY-YIG nuclease family protein [Phycisphaerales bacterium]